MDDSFKRIGLLATALAALGFCCTALGQQRILEEVVVTAQKREESLQDVPISLLVMSGEQIDTQRLTELEDISAHIPNVHVGESASATQLFIRGIGSGVNLGFEQSVGTFIDGIYFGRGRSARNPLLDVARVEVLKGPQGILFGKNTIAGAFNITTRKPSEKFEASADVYYDPKHNTIDVTGIISGPLTETLAGRLVGRYGSDDGWLENTLLGKDGPRRDDAAVRGTFVWKPTDAIEATFKAEYSKFDVDGRAMQLSKIDPAFLPLLQAADPRVEGKLDFQSSTGGTAPLFNKQFDNTDAYNTSLTINWDVGGNTITSITGYVGYDYDFISDSDFTPLSFISQVNASKYDTWSQELRLTSATGGLFEYILGVYYQEEDLFTSERPDVDFTAVPPLVPTISFVSGLFGFPPVLQGGRANSFNQNTTTYAFFGQLMVNVTDRARLTMGLRYTRDEKDATKELFFTSIGVNALNPQVNTLFPVLGLGVPHNFDLTRSEDDLSPAVTIEYDLTDDIMVYWRYAQGFKAGGFDEDNANGNLAAEEFSGESVESWEVGGKMKLLGGAARVNFAAFHSKYNNLQVSTFDGVAAFVVGNAASALSEGIEVDGEWAVTGDLTVGGALSYLNADYEDYPNGACTFAQNAAFRASGAPGSCTQDLGGAPLQFAPEWSWNLFGRFEHPIFANWELASQLDLNYSSDYQIPGDLDPDLAQDDFLKVNARVGLQSTDGRWSIAVIGKNLTNEVTSTWGNDVPLGSFIGNNLFSFVDPERSVALQASVRY